jgi:hypothetical protein
LFVGEQSGVKMATEKYFWPTSAQHLFDQSGVYKIAVTLVPHTGDAHTFEFILQWPGQWDQSHVSLIS